MHGNQNIQPQVPASRFWSPSILRNSQVRLHLLHFGNLIDNRPILLSLELSDTEIRIEVEPEEIQDGQDPSKCFLPLVSAISICTNLLTV